MAEYAEFNLRFERGATPGSYRVEASGAYGQATTMFELPFSSQELEIFILRVGRARRGVRRIESPEQELARAFGGKLFQAVMAGRVGDRYRATVAEARALSHGVRVTVTTTAAPELGQIPWEFLFDDPDFLATSHMTPVVRYLDVPKPQRPLEITLPIRILAVISAPTDAAELTTSVERERLERALRPLTERGAVEVDWLEDPTLLALVRKLRLAEYHILQFIGHGGIDGQQGALLFEDDIGRARVVSGDQLAIVLGDYSSLRLVVLNSSEGARSSLDDPFSSVAASLIERQIPAVIGMQFEITDRAATLFAQEFYRVLAEGRPVDTAVAEARRAIYADGNDVEWATPALFMGVADGHLFAIANAAPLPMVPVLLPPKEYEAAAGGSAAAAREIPSPSVPTGAAPSPEPTAPPDVGAEPGRARLGMLVEAIRAWTARPKRSAKLTIDGDTIELSGLPESEQQRVMQDWIARHGTDAGRTYSAYGRLACDEVVPVGEAFELEVGLSPTQSAGVAGPAMTLVAPAPSTSYFVDVQLFADGFDIAAGESWRQNLEVSTGRLHPTVTVHLVPRPIRDQTANREISATFSIAGETLGYAERSVRVTSAPARQPAARVGVPRASGVDIPAPSGDPKADITIIIKKGVDPGTLLWSVESALPGVSLDADEPPTSSIGEEPERFSLSLIRTLFTHGNAPGLLELLRGRGTRIRDAMPDSVMAALTAAAAATSPNAPQVLLLTDEPYVPWELALLDEPWFDDAPPFLAAQANIGRWILASRRISDPPRSIDANTMAVVWGVYSGPTLPPLEDAEQEAQDLQQLYGAASVDAQGDLVRNLLNGTPPAGILHFAVHGKFDPQTPTEGIQLVKGPPVIPDQIVGSNLRARSPFVFLNACQIGSAQTVLGGYGGVAHAFLQAGASAVVAPLWSIDDKDARQIALAFYKEALAQSADGGVAALPPTVAELLRKARHSFFDTNKAPSATYLAYQFYGHPSLRLTWGGASDGRGPTTS